MLSDPKVDIILQGSKYVLILVLVEMLSDAMRHYEAGKRDCVLILVLVEMLSDPSSHFFLQSKPPVLILVLVEMLSDYFLLQVILQKQKCLNPCSCGDAF